MDIYDQMGTLILGTRLKRIGHRFQQDVSKIYKSHNIHFELSWFPIFYLINQNGSITISEISKKLHISHPAVIQVVNNLLQKKLVIITTDENDARRKNISFSESGQELKDQVTPIWDKIQKVMDDLLDESEYSHELLHAISDYETNIKRANLFERYKELDHE